MIWDTILLFRIYIYIYTFFLLIPGTCTALGTDTGTCIALGTDTGTCIALGTDTGTCVALGTEVHAHL